SQAFVRGRYEGFALDHLEQIEDLDIQHVPGADLLFNHVIASLFRVHISNKKELDEQKAILANCGQLSALFPISCSFFRLFPANSPDKAEKSPAAWQSR